MPRELWAKLAVETRDDIKLVCRPEWERLLWVNLILLAKEKTPDGVLRGYTPSSLRVACFCHAGVKAVGTALDYFQSQGMLSTDNGAITLTNYIKRQGEYDIESERRKWRDRKQKQRDKDRTVTRDTNGHVTNVPPLEEKRTEENRSPLGPPKVGGPHTRLRRGFQNPLPEKPKWQSAGYSSPEEYAEAHAVQLADAKAELDE